MTKEEFIALLNIAKTDDNGNLYIEDISDTTETEFGRKYFGIIQTICTNFADEYYCAEDDEYYDRHFTSNDDTFIIKLVGKKPDEKKDYAVVYNDDIQHTVFNLTLNEAEKIYREEVDKGRHSVNIYKMTAVKEHVNKNSN